MTYTSIYLNNNQSSLEPIQSSASNFHTDSHLTPIYLNLYDLGQCHNKFIHSLGLSFYHCSVQTHSSEYGYLGHPYEITGVYKTSKHDSRFHLYKIRHSIEISWTSFTENQIDRLVTNLEPFYLGFDYDSTKKNSIHFAKYLIEQLANDLQSKHFQSIRILQFPSYIDRIRRLTEIFSFLKLFDTEKDIAEINILYFLYMKFEGNIKRICQILKCDTIEKLNRIRTLIFQGINDKKLPIFPLFSSFNIQKSHVYLVENRSVDNQPFTLTDIFHQFDTMSLRGRTSIDRYLNMKHSTIEIESKPYSSLDQSVQIQSISQNQRKISSRQRKLPRDFEFTNDLYRLKNLNLTNNALSIEDHQNVDSIV